MTVQNFNMTLAINGHSYEYYSLAAAEEANLGTFSKLPYSHKVLLENLLRQLNGETITNEDIKKFGAWLEKKHSTHEIPYSPARVLMQDFTGVPAIVDLASLRAAMTRLGGDPEKINPLIPVDLVIDHSVQVDAFANADALEKNIQFEMQRNKERYQFLRWGQSAFSNFRVVPPGTGICHQVNLEYLAQVVWQKQCHGKTILYPDTLVGTDSHTTMINGLGVLGWGVGGIEAEAAMLGQPISMVIPDVIGVKLTGRLPEGIIATDLVLTITQMLRQHGVVGKFVEFYGSGLDHLPLADRATIANMAPEYGATCGFFPVDQETLNYCRLTGRDPNHIAIIEAYCKAQGLWRDTTSADPVFTENLTLDLNRIEPCVAGPKRPQDRVVISQLSTAFKKLLTENNKKSQQPGIPVENSHYTLAHGDIVIAAITSCTNTSNPSALIAAGLVAKKAAERGIFTKPWVKTSLAPGSKVVTDYLEFTGLQESLNQQGFNLVGYGCTTCIGNSGPLPEPIAKVIVDNDLLVCSILSGNRNFEGRVHPLTKANWLASPPLVVAYALAGTCVIDLNHDPIAQDKQGKAIYLRDIWPSNAEIAEQLQRSVTGDLFQNRYKNVFTGDAHWQSMSISTGKTYHWDPDSTYVQQPPFFENIHDAKQQKNSIVNARILAILGDSVTTDHISPAGNIKSDSPAGEYLKAHSVAVRDFNSYGSRRGNHEVMMRGTFANIRIRNEMLNNVEGGFTRYLPTGDILSIYDAAMRYKEDATPLVVLAGKEYGTGSSRDWAAKGTLLLGVKAVIAESFERIHRSNLLGMGVLPLQFVEGTHRKSLQLTGDELIDIAGLDSLGPRIELDIRITRANQTTTNFPVLCRIDTKEEFNYFSAGGILHFVLKELAIKRGH
jgi:aconitate hydratase